MQRLKNLFRTAALLAPLALIGAPEQLFKITDDIQADKYGEISAAGIKFGIIHYSKEWQGSAQKSYTVKPEKSPSLENGVYSLSGTFTTKSGNFKINENLTAKGKSASYNVSISSAEKISANELALTMSLPCDKFVASEIMVDGKSIILPEILDEKTNVIFRADKTNSLEIKTAEGILCFKGEFPLLVQDDRKYNLNNYTIRLGMTPRSGEITESSLKLDISVNPYQSKALDISSAVNRGFKDEKDGDMEGGWTDQGAENDLRMIKPGSYKFAGINFDIVNPEKNKGKSCIALKGYDRQYFPESATVKLNGENFKYLYILHALAWGGSQTGKPVGTIEISFKDGTNQSLTVDRMQVGDWWNPVNREKGSVVWTGENKSAYVGLYMSQYEINDKPIEAVTFKSAGAPVWMITSVSGSSDKIRLPKNQPYYVVTGSEWKAIDYNKDIEAGSVLDFSGLLDAPAGKYGYLKAVNGKLAFEKKTDTPVRFYGTNYCGSANYLDKEWCERLADRMARTGYNAVRFHHFDDGLVLKKDGKSTELNPEKADQLDYLFYALKKRGIYLTIDLYISRTLVKGEIPEFPDKAIWRESFKGLAFVTPSVMKNWEAFSSNLLNHVNPYTKLAWKDDPALISISLINEDTIFSEWKRDQFIIDIYQAKFEEYLKNNKLSYSNVEQKDKLFTKFLIETYNVGFDSMRAFTKTQGVKSMISDQNMWDNLTLAPTRAKYDYVDNHFYWDHPSFVLIPWKLPATFSNRSIIKSDASRITGSASARVLGKPYMITEFDFSNPNSCSADGGVLVGAYAALQDWDGLFRFAYAHSQNNIKETLPSNFFDTSVDPVKALSERAGIMMFLRGDIKTSDVTVPIAVSENCLDSEDMPDSSPASLNKLALMVKTGALLVSDKGAAKLPADSSAVVYLESKLKNADWKKPAFKSDSKTDAVKELVNAKLLKNATADLEKGIFTSSTGELEINKTADSFKAVSPKSESLILPEKLSGSCKVMSIENKGNRAVFYLGSVDGKDLKDSSRMLLLHLTDCQNSKSKFGSPEMTLLEAYGEAPYLLRKGEAEITLKGEFSKHKVYAVDCAGKRLFEMPVDKSAESVKIKVETFTPKGSVIAYEIVKE